MVMRVDPSIFAALKSKTMLVLKFGGTSVGSVENMTNVKNIINDGQRKVVVFLLCQVPPIRWSQFQNV